MILSDSSAVLSNQNIHKAYSSHPASRRRNQGLGIVLVCVLFTQNCRDIRRSKLQVLGLKSSSSDLYNGIISIHCKAAMYLGKLPVKILSNPDFEMLLGAY